MTSLTAPLPGLKVGMLPRWGTAAAAVGAVVFTLLLFAVTPMQGTADIVVVAAILVVASVSITSWVVEGRRRAKDRGQA